jgi:hypothetical protein
MRLRTPKPLVLFGLLALMTGLGCKGKINSQALNLKVTVRISIATDGSPGTGASVIDRPGISGDGRFVAFTSRASNLIPNNQDTNNASDVFLRDNVLRTTVCVSVTPGPAGVPATGASDSPSVSDDGQFVCFASRAPDITADAVDAPPQKKHIFVRNMATGVTLLVDRAPAAGAKANQDCFNPQISGNGDYVVFETAADNLDGSSPGGADDDAFSDIYRRAWRAPGTPTELISVSSDFYGPIKGNGNSNNPSISFDGLRVAFQSSATNLVPTINEFGPDSNSGIDIFLRDTLNVGNATTIRVSVADTRSISYPDPTSTGSLSSTFPAISADGNFVAFTSTSDNLVLEDDSPANDIFVRDIVNGTTIIASVHSSGAQAGAGCTFPRLSGDGQMVVWHSISTNLIDGDSNGVEDIFLHDRNTGVTERVSVSTFGGQLNGKSLRPNFSRDGRYVVFYTEATNASDDDTNGATDFYLRGPPF